MHNPRTNTYHMLYIIEVQVPFIGGTTYIARSFREAHHGGSEHVCVKLSVTGVGTSQTSEQLSGGSPLGAGVTPM